MIQRLLLLTATLAALFCGSAYGLGLGELRLESALNQEFKADIELTNTRGLAVDEILPNLASQEDFDRVGVQRNYLLTDLRFRITQGDNGKLFVRVTSNKPIIEPFLDFIVEVLWPSGRLLREYTVLLDPPIFGQQGVKPISPSQTFPMTTERRPVPAPPERRQAAEEITQAGEIVDDEYGMTGAGDTLWTIAMKTRPDDSVSIQQTMLALQRANPEAFINDNINLLKAGYFLRIPDRREIMQETIASAIAEVRVQNQEFEDYRSGRVAQLDATRRQSGTGRASMDREDGELRLLAADRSSGQAAGDSAATEALENELSVAREDLDRARRANTGLNVRLDDLAGQLETLNEIVALKDDQLAAFREQIQKMQEAGAEPGVTRSPEPVQPQESLLSNPFVLGGLGVLLIAGVAGGLFFMRRKRQQASLQEDDLTEMALEDAQPTEEAAEQEPEEQVEEAADEGEDEELSPQTSDAISESEIYIAYGRFPQAITFLQNAIEAEPRRVDIQLKLLEVYVQTEDATAFNLQFDQLKMLGDEEASAKGEELQNKIPGASESAEAAMEATVISSEPIAAIDEPEDDDDDLSFDLDDLDAETEDDDLDLGDDLDLDTEPEEDATVEPDSAVVEDGDDLDLDLDADLDLDLDADLDLDLGDDDEDVELDVELDVGDDDSIELDSGDDDDLELDLGDDDLDLGDADDIKLDLGDDDDDLELALEDDGDEDLDLADTADEIELDLGDDDSLDLDELDLDEDASSKLDLARAYIDMGDKDGAKSLLQEIIADGTEADIKEANELMGKLD